MSNMLDYIEHNPQETQRLKGNQDVPVTKIFDERQIEFDPQQKFQGDKA